MSVTTALSVVMSRLVKVLPPSEDIKVVLLLVDDRPVPRPPETVIFLLNDIVNGESVMSYSFTVLEELLTHNLVDVCAISAVAPKEVANKTDSVPAVKLYA